MYGVAWGAQEIAGIYHIVAVGLVIDRFGIILFHTPCGVLFAF